MKNDTTLTAIKSNFSSLMQAYKNSRDELENKIAIRQKQLERLQGRLRKIHWPHWTEQLLRPVLDEIEKQLPGWNCDKDGLLPMGLSCRVSVFFSKEDILQPSNHYTRKTSISIIFTPGDLDKSELLYETGEYTNRYGPGTIGAINGFNRVTKPLESIEEAVALLKAQINTQKSKS
jgi:hypothetical protein